MRTELMEELKLHINFERLDGDLVLFFGAYVKQPSLFKLKLGERRLIKELVKHVQSKIDDEEIGIAFFSPKMCARREQRLESIISISTCTTVIGQYFSDRNLMAFGKSKIADKRGIEDLKQSLLDIAERTLNKLAVKHKKRQLQEFGDESVIVTKSQDSVIKGEVFCTFCEQTSPVVKVKVYFAHRGNGTWVPSNIEKHFRNHHAKKDILRLIETPKQPAPVKIQMKAAVKRVDSPGSVPFIVNCSDNLFTQLTLQKIKVNNAALLNKEMIIEFIVEIAIPIKICCIDPDGNCLFAALAHQIFHDKTNSKLHQEKTKNVRKMVVDHINKNFKDFESYLKTRVLEMKKEVEIEDMEKECHAFLDGKLSQTGIWGGSETLKAVSEIFNVNIIIIREDGVCSIGNRYNDGYKRTILISFREFGGSVGRPNHYDSVIDVSESTLSNFAQAIAESEYKYISMINDINASIISVGD